MYVSLSMCFMKLVNNMCGNGVFFILFWYIVIIMDGNGCWVKLCGFLRKKGYEKGVGVVREFVCFLGDVGFEYLMFYGFFFENWYWLKIEVDDLMGLMCFYFKRDINEIVKNNICVRIIGFWDNLFCDVIEIIDEVE